MSASRLDVLLAETGLDPADQQALVALEEMLALVSDEVPRPSAELQAVLDDGPSIRRRPGHPLRTGVVAGLVGLAATVGLGGVAAASNELPPDMQRVVSQWSQRHLPFTFPMPDRAPHANVVPTHPTPSATALPTPHLLPSPSAVPTGRHSDVGATPAARPDESSSAAQGTVTSKSHHAGRSAPTPSAAGSASPRAAEHGQQPRSAGQGRGAAGSQGRHPTGRPTGVPSAQSKRQDAEHRADKHGRSSDHRRMTQSRRDRSPGAH